VATAVPERAGKLIRELIFMKDGLTSQVSANRLLLLQELATLVGARGEPREVEGVLRVLESRTALPWQMAGLNGLAEGMSRRGVQLGVFLRKSLPDSDAPRITGNLLSQAAGAARDDKREVAERLGAVRLLAHAEWTTARPPLVQLMYDDPAQEIRIAAVRALAAHPHKEVPALLMKSWGSLTPAIRREVLEAMLRQPDRIAFLLDEVEGKRVKPGDIDAIRTRQLVNHGRAEIRDRARKLLQENLPADRKLTLEKYQAALKLPGNVARGKEVFQKNCATCHRVAGVGVDVGPAITDTLGKTADAILVDILLPNQAIDNNFINYTVTTRSGKALTGIIVQETASSITLQRAENQTDVVLRQDIDEIQSTGVSLMPEGLEKNISVQEMADLLFFLKNWRYVEGEGNN
jgi:putative heme-binding domain-containing protein